MRLASTFLRFGPNCPRTVMFAVTSLPDFNSMHKICIELVYSYWDKRAVATGLKSSKDPLTRYRLKQL